MADTFDRILNLWPEPPTNPIDALLHTLDAYADDGQYDHKLVIIATSGMYTDPRTTTGLTWGDLRHIATLLKEQQS
jgi:hypothetical protein